MFRQDPLLKVGLIAMALALALAIVAVVVSIAIRSVPEQAVASERWTATGSQVEPPMRDESLLGSLVEKTRQLFTPEVSKRESDSEPSGGEPEPGSTPFSEAGSRSQADPSPQSEPASQSEPARQSELAEQSESTPQFESAPQSESVPQAIRGPASGTQGQDTQGQAGAGSEPAAQVPSGTRSDLPAQVQAGPTPEPEAQAGSGPEPEAQAGSRSEPEPQAQPESNAQPETNPEQDTLPAEERDWPRPTQQEVEAASEPRHYNLPAGAIMGLTINSINIYNAPVFDSDSQWALANGVAHVPETSLPWSQTAERNVYLAGHRMGFRGTWSRMIFYNLNKIREGDKVVLKDRTERTYEYRVSETFLADPTDAWVMGRVRGRDMVTLQTCTPIPTFEKRLIIRAERL